MLSILGECSKESKSCQCRRANCKSFTDCGSCITGGIELIGNCPDLTRQSCHLRNTTGVICHRSIGIHGDRNSCNGKHSNSCKSHTVESRESCRVSYIESHIDGYCNGNKRNHCAHHSSCDSRNDICCNSCL